MRYLARGHELDLNEVSNDVGQGRTMDAEITFEIAFLKGIVDTEVPYGNEDTKKVMDKGRFGCTGHELSVIMCTRIDVTNIIMQLFSVWASSLGKQQTDCFATLYEDNARVRDDIQQQ